MTATQQRRSFQPATYQRPPGLGEHILYAAASNLGRSRNALEHRVRATITLVEAPVVNVELDTSALCGATPRAGWDHQYRIPGRKACPACAAKEWEAQGRKAFAEGLPAVPLTDSAVLAAIDGLPVGGGAADIMRAWVSGWTAACLAAPLPQED